jgi:hypothetical protein
MGATAHLHPGLKFSQFFMHRSNPFRAVFRIQCATQNGALNMKYSRLNRTLPVVLAAAIAMPTAAFAGYPGPGPFAEIFERWLVEQELAIQANTVTETEIILTAEESAELGIAGEGQAATALRYGLYGVIALEAVVVAGELAAIVYYEHEIDDYEAAYLSASLELEISEADALAEFAAGMDVDNTYSDNYCALYPSMPTCQGWQAEQIIAMEQDEYIETAEAMGQTAEDAQAEFQDGLYTENTYIDAACVTYPWMWGC